MILPIVILVILLLMYVSHKEGYFGFSGDKGQKGNHVSFKIKINSVSPTGYQRNNDAAISHKRVEKLILASQAMVKKHAKICVYPIDTIFMHEYNDSAGNTMYKYRIMYLATDWQYGFEVDTTAMVSAGSDDVVVTEIETDEPSNAQDSIRPYVDVPLKSYSVYDNIVNNSAPSKSAMDLVEKQLKKKVW
jgi:hypothetical protein